MGRGVVVAGTHELFSTPPLDPLLLGLDDFLNRSHLAHLTDTYFGKTARTVHPLRSDSAIVIASDLPSLRPSRRYVVESDSHKRTFPASRGERCGVKKTCGPPESHRPNAAPTRTGSMPVLPATSFLRYTPPPPVSSDRSSGSPSCTKRSESTLPGARYSAGGVAVAGSRSPGKSARASWSETRLPSPELSGRSCAGGSVSTTRTCTRPMSKNRRIHARDCGPADAA